jgi:RNA polymerase sigma factor (sigma-70 family)
LRDELVRRARDGDHDAFAALMGPQIRRLHGLAGLILYDRSRVEDAVQEAMLKAWRDLPRLRDVERFDAWLRRLVVNACRDERRRLRRRADEVAFGPQHEPAIGAGLETSIARDELAGAFRRLSDEQRTVIALRYYLDLSSADAASALGVRQVTYRSKLHRAIAALRAALAAEERQVSEPEGGWT